ncbi:MAG: hypothetical protein DMF96_22990 [Acidobacteria bacterium]|nr:MAG: hypothetical protein DMF96_22990 [Acidobacteriota bacterium]
MVLFPRVLRNILGRRHLARPDRRASYTQAGEACLFRRERIGIACEVVQHPALASIDQMS